LQEVVELTWLLGELVNNFKINFSSQIFENGILIGIKAISVVALTKQYPHIENHLSPQVYDLLLKIAKNLKNLPLQIGKFPEITKYSDEAQLAAGFIEILIPFRSRQHLEINTGK
jgi:hypothetical protein